MIRSLLRKTISPPFESLLDRLEQRVTVEDHREHARRIESRRGGLDAAPMSPSARSLAEELFASWGDALADRATAATPRPVRARESVPFDDPEAALRTAAEADGAAPTVFDLLGLLPPNEAPQNRAEGLAEFLRAVAGKGPFREDRLSREGPEAACLLLAAQRAGRLPSAEASEIALAFASDLPPRRWFARAGTPRGTASLLRCLVAGDAVEAPQILERLLRHVEIRREDALRLRPPEDLRQQRLEQLRFTLALLEGAERLHDLRLLNAALKLNDRHLLALRRRRTRRVGGALIEMHYLVSIALQERLMKAFIA